jgi:glycerol-3-phosphate O-acyltransferase/dihydroxyacetone phosphate acyltransferase
VAQRRDGFLRRVIKGLLQVAFSIYYRTINVSGIERFPESGPVLLVANHPNALLDPAILVHLLPRRVTFGAKHTLFKSTIFRPILEAFGAIPLVRASDDPGQMSRNIESLQRFAGILEEGHVVAIFPEGISHDDPQVAPLKTGAARVALLAESAREFRLGLTILPIGLQFHPQRDFRAEAIVRIGESVQVADLATAYGDSPRECVRELTDRINTALKTLTLHLEDPQKLSLAGRISKVYWCRMRQTGIGATPTKALRGEMLQKIAVCINHYQNADPDIVAELERQLERYDRLRMAAGIDRRLLEEPSRLLPGMLGPVQAVVEAVLGCLPAGVGFLTGAIPYYLTKWTARRVARQGGAVTLSLGHILAGALAFPLFYGALIALVATRYSDRVTIALALLLVPTGIFARAFAKRMRVIVAHIGVRTASWFKLGAVARVREARDELVHDLDALRNRYRTEVMGWEALPGSGPE